MKNLSTPKIQKMGRPAVDTSPITVRVHATVLQAIEAARRDLETIPSRPELVRIAVTEWLREKGYLK
jgi:hypothetical protein